MVRDLGAAAEGTRAMKPAASHAAATIITHQTVDLYLIVWKIPIRQARVKSTAATAATGIEGS